jgi:hypothetical protein
MRDYITPLVLTGIVTCLLALACRTVSAPVRWTTEAACLKAGYPLYAVTWDFEAYCIAADGTVKSLNN